MIPLLIVAVFLLGVIAVGKLASRRIKTSEDYMVAGRGAGLPLIVGTLFATFWGGGVIIGATGASYDEGIFGVVEDPFAAGLSLILVGVFFVRILRGLKIRSVGELYKCRFGTGTGYLASALMIPTYVVWTAVQLLAIGKIVNVLFGIDFTVAFLGAALVVVLFTYMGGLVAVVWTDAVQMVIIFIGLLAILAAGFSAAGGVEHVLAVAPDGYWNILPRDRSPMGWVSYLAMWAGMSLGNIPSPDIAQRAFIAKDSRTAYKGMIIAGSLYWTVGFIPIVIALIGIALVGDGTLDASQFAHDSELLVPYMAKALLGPVGLGVFVASLIAAVLSSASTSLFATAVLFSNDIYKPLKASMTGKLLEDDDAAMLRATKFFVVTVGVLSVGVGLVCSFIYELTIFAFTLQLGVLFFPFVLALKARWVTAHGVIAGMVGGVLVNLAGCLWQGSIIPEPWEFFTLVPPLVNLALIVVVSALTRERARTESLESLYF
ncbi:sodium:solute symporter family transporter [Salidesulfovibrio onnuriiensis]|uniref:sodium:solute symporter family transporter n=1 Tax=Salidesulfovibrio onnuriiensis TaxID=2583823 RepID=UPI001650B027|nr:hypothetical protein [Salidesulfovibrio onnuriiensis]